MKKLINKITLYGYKTILIFTIICLSIALLGATFFYFNRSFKFFNPIILIIGTIVYLVLLAKFYKYTKDLTPKRQKITAFILILLQLILLTISSLLIRSVPKVDLIHILTELNSLHDTGKILNNVYFSVYPNNRFLLLVLYAIQKINYNNREILFSVLSILSIITMSLFTYKTIKIHDSKKALTALFITVTSPIFYLYVSYYYTDILMLPTASILLYLIVKSKDNKTTTSNILYGLLIGILSIIGYKIRAVCIFLLIAYIVYLIITEHILTIIKKITPVLISALITITCINNLETNFFKEVDNSKVFPMTHWIMMGLNEEHYGYYSQDDYNLSSSAKNKEERTKLNIKEIKSRLKSLGPIGLIKLDITKLVNVWGKGDYSYQKYLSLVQNYNKSYQYLVEEKNMPINYLLQFSKITILLLTILSLIKLSKTNEKSITAIAIFGAVVFYLIWEVCPRYGLSFLPWLIILSTYSYDDFISNNVKVKSYQYLKYTIIILTVIMFGLYFNKYTKYQLIDSTVAKDTENKVKYLNLNKDQTITQSLKLNSTYNVIKLKFNSATKENDNTYKLLLLDENKNVIYTKEFLERDITNGEYYSFILDNYYQKGTYYITLTSNQPSSLMVYCAYKEKFDYYKDGALQVNENNEEGDLMFEIINQSKRGIYKKSEYLIIFFTTLITECLILLDCNSIKHKFHYCKK